MIAAAVALSTALAVAPPGAGLAPAAYTAAVAAAAVPKSSEAALSEWIALRQRAEMEAPPLALALEMTFGATTWARVDISTHGAASDMTELVRAGFYKQELIQLILVSALTGKPMQEGVDRRGKGMRLSQVAGELGVEHSELYEAALAVEELVDREYLPRFPERRRRRRRSPE